ncbi:MAG: Fur family transcriptional regulator [Candidatus Woesearchaeota archaeon]
MAQTRMTTQRVRILEYLQGTESHPTAHDIYREVSQDLPTLTLATVYRNLKALEDQGEVMKFKVGETYHYDAKDGDHIHVITDDGQIEDVERPDVVRYVKRKLREEGYEPDDVRIVTTGIKK